MKILLFLLALFYTMQVFTQVKPSGSDINVPDGYDMPVSNRTIQSLCPGQDFFSYKIRKNQYPNNHKLT